MVIKWFNIIIGLILLSGIPTITILFWKRLDKETKKKFWKGLWSFWILLVPLFLAFALFWNHGYFPSGSFMNRIANSLTILIALFWIMILCVLGWLRYFSTQSISNGVSGSCAYYVERGDYVIAMLGSINYFVTLLLGNKTLVVPKEKFYRLKEGGDLSNFLTKIAPNRIVELDSLPFEALELLNNDRRFSRDNVWYGELTQEEKEYETTYKQGDKIIRCKPLVKLEQEIMSMNRTNNILKGVRDGNMKSIDKFYSTSTGLNEMRENS